MNNSEQTATVLVDDLEASLVTYVRNLLKLRLQKNPAPNWMYRTGSVFEFGASNAGYVVLVDDSGEIVYFVRHMLIKHNGFRLGRQVLVWADKTSPITTGFALKVFFERLLPKYKALIADQHQTEHGYRFWRYALDRAFERSLHVYFLDRRSSPNRLLEFFSLEQMLPFNREIWGKSEGHKRTFAVISEVPLTLRQK